MFGEFTSIDGRCGAWNGHFACPSFVFIGNKLASAFGDDFCFKGALLAANTLGAIAVAILKFDFFEATHFHVNAAVSNVRVFRECLNRQFKGYSDGDRCSSYRYFSAIASDGVCHGFYFIEESHVVCVCVIMLL